MSILSGHRHNKDLSNLPAVSSYAEPALCDLYIRPSDLEVARGLLWDTEPLKPLP